MGRDLPPSEPPLQGPRIRILSVCPQLTTGGAERQLLYFCRHIDRARFDMRLIYYEGAGEILTELNDLGVSVIHIDRTQLGGLGLLRALRRAILSQRPDVLDCRLPSGYRFGRLAALGAGVPVILAQERTTINGGGIRRRFDRLCNLWTDAWIGNSRAVAEHIARDLRVPDDRIHVIYNGIDADRLRSASKHPLMERWRQAGRRIVLNLGGLRPPKNQRLFLRTCDQLRRRFADPMFVLCGDGELRAPLETYAAELGLAGQCHFLGHQPDVAPVLAAADLLIQSSDQEGLPNAVMEAMAAGVPVVATDAGGTRELIDGGVHGLLVPVGDEAGLVAGASQVLSDSSVGRRLAEKAYERIRAAFTMQAMMQAYAQLLERLVARKKGAPAAF